MAQFERRQKRFHPETLALVARAQAKAATKRASGFDQNKVKQNFRRHLQAMIENQGNSRCCGRCWIRTSSWLRIGPATRSVQTGHSHQPKGSGISESTIRPIFLCASAALRVPQEFFRAKAQRRKVFQNQNIPFWGKTVYWRLPFTNTYFRNVI